MGTTFSVLYANIFMIWLETPIIEEFIAYIVEYKRLLDDLLLLWSGSIATLREFRRRLARAQAGIFFEWQDGDTAEDDEIMADKLCKVHFLDLNIRIMDWDDCVWLAEGGTSEPTHAFKLPGDLA